MFTKRNKQKTFFYRSMAVVAFVVGSFLLGLRFFYQDSVRYFTKVEQTFQETGSLESEFVQKELFRQTKHFLNRRDSFSRVDKEKIVASALQNGLFPISFDQISPSSTQSEDFFFLQKTLSVQEMRNVSQNDWLDSFPKRHSERESKNRELFISLASQEENSDLNAALSFLKEFEESPLDRSELFLTSDLSSSEFDFAKNPLNRLQYLCESDLLTQETSELRLIKIGTPLTFLWAIFSLLCSAASPFVNMPFFEILTESVRLWLIFLDSIAQTVAKYCLCCLLKFYEIPNDFYVIPSSILLTQKVRLLF